MLNVSPVRLENEPFEVYKERLKLTNQAIKRYLKGRLLWDSVKGTYKR